MARPLRIEFAGALYHITSRGIERREIFRAKDDRIKFLEYLQDGIKKLNIILYCYVLMDNHYHLLIETKDGNLSKFMHNLNTSHTIYFNRKYKRVGPLFQGRYKAIIIEKDEYLLELSRYIHLNPVRVKTVEAPEDYKWSSYRGYIESEEKYFVYTEWLKGYFGEEYRRRYKEFVKDGIDKENPLKKVKHSFILGGEKFVEKIKKILMKEEKERDETPSYKKITSVDRDKVIEEVVKYFNINKEIIFDSGKGNVARKVVIYILKGHTQMKLSEIGKIFSLSYSGVTKTYERFKREMEKDRKMEKIVDEIYAKVKT